MTAATRYPKITIDHTKCTVPFLCKKCLQVCPTAIFYNVAPSSKQEKGKELDPRVDGNYILYPVFVNKCTACKKCVEVCPVVAIKVETA